MLINQPKYWIFENVSVPRRVPVDRRRDRSHQQSRARPCAAVLPAANSQGPTYKMSEITAVFSSSLRRCYPRIILLGPNLQV